MPQHRHDYGDNKGRMSESIAEKHQALSLAEFPLFSGVPARVRHAFERAAVLRNYSAGEKIIHLGEAAEHIYFLLKGSVFVMVGDEQGRSVVAKIFSAPSFFGEMEAFSGEDYIEDVIAAESVSVARFSVQNLRPLLEGNPHIYTRVFRDVCVRFRTTALNQLFLGTENTEIRLAAMVLALLRVHGETSDEGVRLKLILSQETLAAAIGATMRSVQRVLRKWRNEGLLKLQGKYYVAADLCDLEALHTAIPYDHTLAQKI